MIPSWSIPVTGAVLTAVSRAVNGEVSLSDGTRQRLDHARDGVKMIADLVGDVSLDRPGSWGRFLERLIDLAVEPTRRFRDAKEARAAMGFTRHLSLPQAVAATIYPRLEWHTVFDDEDDMLRVAQLTADIAVCVQEDRDPARPSQWYAYPEVACPREDLLEEIARCFWSTHRAVMLETTEGGFEAHPFDLRPYEYVGERLALIAQWRRFMEASVRRNVVLQGPPGCGKSTLCYHAARALCERTILLSARVLREFRSGQWFDLIDLLAPDMIIIDDVDRAEGRHRSVFDDKLQFFEEGRCTVPLLLCTTNEHSKLPAALRRPGRIDQIIQFEEPSPQIQRLILSKLAEEVGVDLPEARTAWLLQLLNDYSVAHVKEAMRRAKIIGWGEARAGDVTFFAAA